MIYRVALRQKSKRTLVHSIVVVLIICHIHQYAAQNTYGSRSGRKSGKILLLSSLQEIFSFAFSNGCK